MRFSMLWRHLGVKRMFVKLALRNVRRQLQNYLIYFITVALSVALMFAVMNLFYSEAVQTVTIVNDDMQTIFGMILLLSAFVTALVLRYATMFMLKLRRKEFGMYLTLGMTRRNICFLFACETGILSGIATLVGMGAGLLIYQLLSAMFASILDIPFTVSFCSLKGVLFSLLLSAAMFLLSTIASLRYLIKAAISVLLQEEAAEKSEKHPVLFSVLSAILVILMVLSGIMTYRCLIRSFDAQDGASILVWLAWDLLLIFLTHVSLSRTVSGFFIRCERLKNRGLNAVILRGLSRNMTMNSVLIGALAVLLCFAVVLCNIAFSEKVYAEKAIVKDCPYDVMAIYDLSREHRYSMEEGRHITEQYGAIASQLDYQLYTNGETAVAERILGYEMMGFKDRYMPLSQFNALLSGCGYEPVILGHSYLIVTRVLGITDIDYRDRTLTLNGEDYTWAGSSESYPSFSRDFYYIVIPDEAIAGMTVCVDCSAYTLENPRPDALRLIEELTWYEESEDGPVERCDYRLKEYVRLYQMSLAGTLIIGALYVFTIFMCMAFAILSLKTLSSLDDDSRRYAVLYRLGADTRMRKSALFRQIGLFFLMPAALPMLLTLPVGIVFGKVYRIWGFLNLNAWQAMEYAFLIAFVVASVYLLYFMLTYRIAAGYVIRPGSE
ncbi:MAG: ABC transporter permease [Eubacteriales bacterium]